MRDLYEFYGEPRPLLAWTNALIDDLQAGIDSGIGTYRTALSTYHYTFFNYPVTGDEPLAVELRRKINHFKFKATEEADNEPRHNYLVDNGAVVEIVTVSDAESAEFKKQNPKAVYLGVNGGL